MVTGEDLVKYAVRLMEFHMRVLLFQMLASPDGLNWHYILDVGILNSGAGGDARRLVVMVIFIGGVTFAEISALRFLESQVCVHSVSSEAVVFSNKLLWPY